MTTRKFVRRAVVQTLFEDMIKHRDKAVAGYNAAVAITAAYVDTYEEGKSRFFSKIDAERASSSDSRFQDAVASNQMYDRFAMRDAAVLTALLKTYELGLLDIKDESNNGNKP